MPAPRKTTIICTLGPATDTAAAIAELIDAGANIFRLNMSHSQHDWTREVVQTIRELGRKRGEHIGILMDTQGPAIRTGDLSSNLDLRSGDIMEFTVRGAKSEEEYSVDVNYDGLIDDIAVGDTVLVDNGVIRMKVLEKKSNHIKCEVLTPGELTSRRHINLPGVKVGLPPLTEKDKADTELGAHLGVDYVALSFVKERADLDLLRAHLKKNGSAARVIAKIEDQAAVRNIDELILGSDGVMVARGDLGIECSIEELPIIQRRLIKQCITLNKPVIVATHLLESMIENPLPTRAEITDVANAVFEQADAVMLSGESAVGRYPAECVRVLDRVARRIERSGGAGYSSLVELKSQSQKTVHSAVVLANSMKNSRLLIFTRRGDRAAFASNLRVQATTYAFCASDAICRKTLLQWGIVPMQINFNENPNLTVNNAIELLKQQGHVSSGDNLVVVSDVLAGEFLYDSVQVRVVD